jgi:hypothetical protein
MGIGVLAIIAFISRIILLSSDGYKYKVAEKKLEVERSKFLNPKLKDCELFVEEAKTGEVEGLSKEIIPKLYVVRCPVSTTTSWTEQQDKQTVQRNVAIQ